MFLIGYGEGEPSARFDIFRARGQVESVPNGALWMKSSAKQKSLFLITKTASKIKQFDKRSS